MIFPYPALRKDVRVLECRRGERIHFEAQTGNGTRILIPEHIADLLTSLDGGHVNPYRLPELAEYSEAEIDRLLLELVDMGLLKKHSRINRHEGISVLISLIPVRLCRTAAVCHTTLFLLFVLPAAFFLSLLLLPGRFLVCEIGTLPEWAITSAALGILLLGCLLHECGHGFAAAAMGGSTAEMGVFALLCIPFGFYMAYQPPEHCSRFARFAISVCGVSMNALLALICLLLCGHTGNLDMTLLMGAIYNLILVVFNLLPAPGLDGGSMLEALTGIPDIHRRALRFLCSGAERRALFRRRPGRAVSAVCAYLAAGIGAAAAFVWSVFSILSLFL